MRHTSSHNAQSPAQLRRAYSSALSSIDFIFGQFLDKFVSNLAGHIAVEDTRHHVKNDLVCFRLYMFLDLLFCDFDRFKSSTFFNRSLVSISTAIITDVGKISFSNYGACFFAFHNSIVIVVIVIGIAHILVVHAEVEARIIIEQSFGLAFFVFSAVIAMTLVYLSIDFHNVINCLLVFKPLSALVVDRLQSVGRKGPRRAPAPY